MREALRILLGNEVENLVGMGFAKDSSVFAIGFADHHPYQIRTEKNHTMIQPLE